MANKKILILGAAGTLGHKLLQIGNRLGYTDYGTIRKYSPILKKIGILKEQLFCDIDIAREKGIKKLEHIVTSGEFNIVVNCIGVIPQKAKDPIKTVYCNSLFPHKVARMCSKSNAKLIHISTDCVFSGRKGMYTDSDEPDATDLYGKSKELGEICYAGHLTIRTSFIGREISDKKAGLLEWFLSQTGEVNGYSKVIWSGVTTNALSEIIYNIISDFPKLHGLVQIANQPIDKYSLLLLFKKYFNKDIVVNKEDKHVCNRSLKMSEAIENKINIPTYEEMIEEMSQEKYP